MTLEQQRDTVFRDLYAQYAAKIHRICLGYTGNAMEADDLLQEVFIKVWQNYDKFRGESKIATWIYRIAVNTCLYHIRSQKNKKTTAIENSNIHLKTEEPDSKEQQIQLLYKCISELAESDRLIITMLLEDVPYAEIAAATEISEGNLRVKIHRIKQQLSTIYKKYERV
ncbi:RNA polymerase sigma factor [Flavobacterium inviolabile]|uniref:RNA polymerase sigma factor n=1 Tax=Flavobacterium inviolabile TaxID=2748320 RepID=UPI0015A96E92|nr:RNA polymerase sigma factor [Flavobacterium inviolabile]